MKFPSLKYWVLACGMTASSIVLFVAIHELGWRIGAWLTGEVKPNLAWGISIRLALGIFSGIAVVLSIVWEVFLRDRKLRWIALTLAVVLFSGIWLPEISYTPHRTILLIISGL